MKITIHILILFFLGLAMTGCFDDTAQGQSNASVPATGKIKILGKAAGAVAAAKVSVKDSEGDEVFSGELDSSESFQADLDIEDLEFPLVVDVEEEDGSLLSGVILDEDGLEDGEEFAVVINEFTDRALDALLGKLEQGEITEEQFIAEGEALLSKILGESVEFEIFYDDEGWFEEEDCAGEVLLNGLMENAEGDTLDFDEYLDGLYEDDAALFESELSFQLEIVSQLMAEGTNADDEILLMLEDNAEELEVLLLSLESALNDGVELPAGLEEDWESVSEDDMNEWMKQVEAQVTDSAVADTLSGVDFAK